MASVGLVIVGRRELHHSVDLQSEGIVLKKAHVNCGDSSPVSIEIAFVCQSPSFLSELNC